jgi:hypothetical protein
VSCARDNGREDGGGDERNESPSMECGSPHGGFRIVAAPSTPIPQVRDSRYGSSNAPVSGGELRILQRRDGEVGRVTGARSPQLARPSPHSSASRSTSEVRQLQDSRRYTTCWRLVSRSMVAIERSTASVFMIRRLIVAS